ncbi:MAG: hypothetical protein AAF389_16275 [Gemmatimonadota bacterium]
MIRALLFLALAAGAVAYTYWVYVRVELPVPGARRLAAARAAALVLVLLLLFDPKLPSPGNGAQSGPWVLLDASLSMSATSVEGVSLWERARTRADELASDGYRVVRFGGASEAERDLDVPAGSLSELTPSLQLAAESGAREVVVLSDMRFDDAVALRSALQLLPLDVRFESVGASAPNAGVRSLTVSDVRRPTDAPVAEVEVFGGVPGDSVEVAVWEDDREVARAWVAAPSAGRATRQTIPLPPATESGRTRYTARLVDAADAYPDDGMAPAYANIGHEEGGIVLVSLTPDWEPRYLLPVLQEVSGLPTSGFLAAGDDQWVSMGRAEDRAGPVDSTTVRTAAASATVLVVHGLGAEHPEWLAALATAPGRHLTFATDRAGSGLLGIATGEPEDGEWYASPDVPVSPIAGSLSGIDVQGLPPLGTLLTPDQRDRGASLNVQRSGAGAPTTALVLDDHEEGRRVVALASGFWRWAARDEGRAAYRQLWSAVVGWLLADQTVTTAEPRPLRRVVARDTPVEWGLGGLDGPVGIVVSRGDSIVSDTVFTGPGTVSSSALPPGEYSFTALSGADTVSGGRFDVASTTDEMIPVPFESSSAGGTSGPIADLSAGIPLRTTPWPYLAILLLLCGEWIVRRRSGLR